MDGSFSMGNPFCAKIPRKYWQASEGRVDTRYCTVKSKTSTRSPFVKVSCERAGRPLLFAMQVQTPTYVRPKLVKWDISASPARLTVAPPFQSPSHAMPGHNVQPGRQFGVGLFGATKPRIIRWASDESTMARGTMIVASGIATSSQKSFTIRALLIHWNFVFHMLCAYGCSETAGRERAGAAARTYIP